MTAVTRMKAITRNRYGPPEVLSLAEIPRPVPGEGEILVRVRNASVNAGDRHLMRGHPYLIRLLFGGLRTPKIRSLGVDLAGDVAELGSGATAFKPGDRVFGELSRWGFGAFADYVVAPEEAFLSLSPGSDHAAAATLPTAGLAALQGLRDAGRIREGQKVMVNGASGGVGSFAVQLARIYGGEVTAVCRQRSHELIRSLGAHYVMDYTREDPARSDQRFDLILDAAGYRSFLDYRHILNPGGTYVLVGGAPIRTYQMMLLGPGASLLGKRRMAFLISKPNREDLSILEGLLAEGKIAPVVDSRFPLAEVPAALRHLEGGHPQGKIVIDIQS